MSGSKNISTKLSDSTLTFNLGEKRKQKLFDKSLSESARRKKRITEGQLVREAIDKYLKE